MTANTMPRPKGASSGEEIPLDLRGVTVRAVGKDILEDVSISAAERRIGIVGRNGSGKTTLARVIAGLQVPASGSVRIFGVDPVADRKGALRTIGILFQNPEHQLIFPTVAEEIAFGLTQLGHSRSEAGRETQHMLARFGKAHWAGAATASLSQGQKKLVCLLAVLAMRPKLIVLDEPLAGLDIAMRMQLERHFNSIEATIVQISHEPESFSGFERVVWLDEGKVREDGEAGDVLVAFERQMRIWGEQDDFADLSD